MRIGQKITKRLFSQFGRLLNYTTFIHGKKKTPIFASKNTKTKNNQMKLTAITYCYTQSDVLQNVVVGVFTKAQLGKAIQEIRFRFKEETIKKYEYDEKSGSFFLEYEDKENTHFYSGEYTVGELKL